MLDNILNLVKDNVANIVAKDNIVPEDKKMETVETTTNALASGLKQNFNLGNMGSLMSFFNGSTSLSSTNPIVTSLINTVTNALVKQTGLSQVIATTISTTVVPKVLQAISGKVNDPKEKGFNLESLVNAFSGSKENTATGEPASISGEILGGLGKLFGK